MADDPVAERLLARVAADENLHMIFYRNLVAAAFELAPNETMQAVTHELLDFQMPGEGMPNYTRDAATIAKVGIYDLNLHLNNVVASTINYWGIDYVQLSGEGDRAREQLKIFLADANAQVTLSMERRDSIRARLATAGRKMMYLDANSKLVRIEGDKV